MFPAKPVVKLNNRRTVCVKPTFTNSKSMLLIEHFHSSHGQPKKCNSRVISQNLFKRFAASFPADGLKKVSYPVETIVV